MIDKGEFLEYDEHNKTLYGTLYSAVSDAMKKGNVVLDVDPHGALNVRRIYPDATLIFILPPSWEELERRLRARGDTSEEQIKLRLEQAEWEIKQAPLYDFRVINDQVEACAEEILKMIAAKAD